MGYRQGPPSDYLRGETLITAHIRVNVLQNGASVLSCSCGLTAIVVVICRLHLHDLHTVLLGP
eukprot:3509297-Amphidinium_carterae.1